MDDVTRHRLRRATRLDAKQDFRRVADAVFGTVAEEMTNTCKRRTRLHLDDECTVKYEVVDLHTFQALPPMTLNSK